MAITKRSNSRTSLPSLWDEFFERDPFFSSSVGSTARSTMPSVNIRENKDEYKVEVAAPGMKKDNFNIELDNDTLIISSEHSDETTEGGKKENYTRKEFSYQSFQRSFSLPQSVEREKISAKYSDGILMISIPKKEDAKEKPVKRINIS